MSTEPLIRWVPVIKGRLGSNAAMRAPPQPVSRWWNHVRTSGSAVAAVQAYEVIEQECLPYADLDLKIKATVDGSDVIKKTVTADALDLFFT